MLQQALATISQDKRFTVQGSSVKIAGQQDGGNISHNGKKFILTVAGRSVELGENLDSTALSIIERNLKMRRAVGD